MSRPAGKTRSRAKKLAEISMLAIARDELEAFRVQLPEYRRYETYRLMAAGWDIVRALLIIHKYPRDPQPIDVALFANNYGFTFIPEGEPGGDLPKDSGLFYVNTSTVMSDRVDIARPVLIALRTIEGSPRPGAIQIDGLHRLFKAARLGRKTLPAYILTPEEEQTCRL